MVHKKNVSYVTVNAKIMPARGKRACSLFPERSLSYAKIQQKTENEGRMMKNL